MDVLVFGAVFSIAAFLFAYATRLHFLEVMAIVAVASVLAIIGALLPTYGDNMADALALIAPYFLVPVCGGGLISALIGYGLRHF